MLNPLVVVEAISPITIGEINGGNDTIAPGIGENVLLGVVD